MVVTENNVSIFSMVAQELSPPGEYRAASRGVQKKQMQRSAPRKKCR
jgi:hypothetical protein